MTNPSAQAPTTLHGFTAHASALAERQYAQPNDDGLHGIFQRVAHWIASADPQHEREQRAHDYYALMAERRFCPGGRVLAGANTNHNNALNCFVQDESPHAPGTTDGALALATKLALVTKVGGGNGLNLDAIPPKRVYAGPIGHASITIAPDHPDHDRVKNGTYRDLTIDQYITKPYQHLHFSSQPDTSAHTRITVEDNVESIWNSAADMVRALLQGHDVLVDLSALRPEGALVRGSGGTSSGPASFAVEIYENYARWAALGGAEHAGPVATLRYVFATALRSIKQGGSRRGAGMATLDANHPDILDFITAKDLERERDEGDISTFNISVLASNDFMRAATREGRPAAKLLHEIAQHAWSTGEPGLIFIDRVNQHNAVRPLLGDIRSTNPCVTGDTRILTLAGPKRFDAIADGPEELLVWAVDPEHDQRVVSTMKRPHRTRQNTPTLRVTFESGLSLRVTHDHKFLLPHLSERIEARELTPGSEIASWEYHDRKPALTTDTHALERVKSIEDAGRHDVYNGMVEGFHNYLIVSEDNQSGVVSANCGEVPLTPGEPCDLGAINLAHYLVRDPDGAHFDRPSFEQDVRTAVRFLDNVLDLNGFALEQNREMSHYLRRLGLGVMGLADTLIELGVRYDSDEGRATAHALMTALRETALAASQELARERGAFPAQAQLDGLEPRRNLALLTVAPTGTTSMLFGVSSGIEPNFAAITYRKIGTQQVTIVSPLLESILADHTPASGSSYRGANGAWDWEELANAIAAQHGSIQALINDGDLPEDPRLRAFVTAHEISPRDHVLMQATIQRAFDAGGDMIGNSLSKTINMPRIATVSDVLDAYTLAHEQGSKGITVYRDGSRDLQVLNTSKTDTTSHASVAPRATKKPVRAAIITSLAPPTPNGSVRAGPDGTHERGTRMHGFTDQVRTTDVKSGHNRNFFVTINTDEHDSVREVFITSGKAGDEANADAEALGRLISIALQYGVPTRAIIKTLRGINGGLYGTYQNRIITSKADLIAVALATAGDTDNDVQHHGNSNGSCPDCGAPLNYAEGCATCSASCGYSRCGG